MILLKLMVVFSLSK